jgi:hypothetical protein
MAFVAVAASVGTAVGLTGVAATIGGGALIGAGVGGLYSAVTGDGDILNSMLTGGLIGGVGAFGLNALGVGAGTTAAGSTAAGAGATGAGTIGPAATTVATSTPAMEAAALLDAAAVAEGGTTAGMATQYAAQEAAKNEAAKVAAKALTGKEMLGYGLAGTTAMQLLGGKSKGANAPTDPGMIRPYEFSANPVAATGEFPSPYATAQYDAAGMPIMDTRERNYFDQKYTALTPYSARSGTPNPNVPKAAAAGGLMAIGGPVERMSQNVMGGQDNMYPQSQQPVTSFATPSQMPVSAEIVRSDFNSQTRPYSGITMAEGGITYDPATQRYSGLPSSASAAPVEELSADLVASLTPQYQAANPNFFSYDAKNQRYSAGIPTMAQLQAFKTAQDQKETNSFIQDPFFGFGFASGAANGGLMGSYAMGGDVMGYNLGGYSDGGRLLKGPGDGVSDDIPATIAGKQPARLADGEFVIPARIVSEIGNGSTDAGAKRLYAMMDRIQDGRKKTIGKGKIAKDTKAKKHLLA